MKNLIKEFFDAIYGLLIFTCVFLGFVLSLGQLVTHPAIGFPILFFLIIIIIIINKIRNKNKRAEEIRRYENKRCQHSIPGGETMSKCMECQKIKYEKSLREKREKEEAQRKEKIKMESDLLMKEESRRISNNLLSHHNYLLEVHPRKFEELVAELFCKYGYDSKLTSYTNDEGKDIVLVKDNKKFLVECKKYAIGHKVSRPDIQKFYAAIIEESAIGGYFFSTSDFAETVFNHKFIKEGKIKLINGVKLSELFQKAYPVEGDNKLNIMCKECGSISKIEIFDDDNEDNFCENAHVLPKYSLRFQF
jgi:restriction system protein